MVNETLLSVMLPSGNRAIYSVQPHILIDRPGSTLNQRAIEYGQQMAHAVADRWYLPGGWVEITDKKTLALIDRCPHAIAPRKTR